MAGHTWRSYQEDTDINLANNTPVAKSQYTVPLTSRSGTFTGGTNVLQRQQPVQLHRQAQPAGLFTSNGGNNSTPSNPQAKNYAPLQQLSADLTNNTVAQYNWITPDQYNDMHSTLTNGFTYHGQHLTDHAANIAQGDNFASILVPQIGASQA